MLSTDKKVSSLYEKEVFSAWVNTFKAQSRTEQEVNVEGKGRNLAELQVTDRFLFRCCVWNLMKTNSLVEMTKDETMPFKSIETILLTFLQPSKRLGIAERTQTLGNYTKKGRVIRWLLNQTTRGSKVFRFFRTEDHCSFGSIHDAMTVHQRIIKLLKQNNFLG